MDPGDTTTPIQDTMFPEFRRDGRQRRSSVDMEPRRLGCLSLLDGGEQHLEIRPRASRRLTGLISEPSTTFSSVQAKPVIQPHRPRAILSSPENDELSSEREDERVKFPSKIIVQTALSSKARSFSSLREDLPKSPLPPQEKNVTPRSALSMEVEKTQYFPLEEDWKGPSFRMKLEKFERLYLEKAPKAPKAPPSPFESPDVSVSEEFERPFASISDECKRPFASISDEECEHPFVSVLDKEARSMINASSCSRNNEATSSNSFYDCHNKEIILQEGYAPSIEVTKEIEKSKKILTINVKKQEPLDRNTSTVINSRRRSEADENRTNMKTANGIIGKKLNSLPSSPFNRGAKQHTPTTKTTSGKVVKPWY